MPAQTPTATLPPLLADTMPPERMLLATDGRIGRRDWWLWGVLAPLGLALVGHALLGVARVPMASAEKAVNLLLLWPTLAVSAKRWHDRDRSAWWALVVLVPLVGWVYALVCNGFLRGTPGPNRFGAEPASDDAWLGQASTTGRLSTGP